MRPNDTIRRLLRSFLLGCFALLLASSAYGQQEQTTDLTPEEGRFPAYRAHGTWFVRLGAGPNFYGGDRDVNVGNSFQSYVESIGLTILGEAGYSITNRFSLSLQYYLSRYPRIEDIVGEDGPFELPSYGDSRGAPLDPSTTSKTRHHLALVGRSYVWPERRFTPYGHYGLHVSFGRINDDLRTAIGPMAGIGFDVYSTPRIGIFVELDGVFAFNDRALDLADTRSKRTPDTPEGIDASDFDAFTHFLAGIRFNFSAPPGPPINVECGGPMQNMTLIPDEVGEFVATINEDARRPVDYSWDYGDGTRESGGLIMQHAYSSPGTYEVTVTATNRDGSDSATCPVVVLEPPTCQITATPPSLDTCERPLPPVQFRSRVTGSPELVYNWNFGDGNTSTLTEPSHRYTRTDAEPTTLTRITTLTVSNPAGSATCSVPINIEQCSTACPFAGQGPAAFFGVDFNRNESVLTDEGRRQLQQNLEVFLRDPGAPYPIFVTGYAQENEINAQELADDRARAIRQFYIDNGIAPDRITFLPELGRYGVVISPATKGGRGQALTQC